MTRASVILIVVLVILLAPAALAQDCNGAGGAPISGQNPNPYSAVGSVYVQTEGATGTFTCTMNITVPRYQPVLTLRYQEGWYWDNPDFIICGGNFCKNTITVTLSGPGVSDTETLTADGTTRPSSTAGSGWALFQIVEMGEVWGAHCNQDSRCLGRHPVGRRDPSILDYRRSAELYELGLG